MSHNTLLNEPSGSNAGVPNHSPAPNVPPLALIYHEAVDRAEARHAGIQWLGAMFVGAITPAILLDDAFSAWRNDTGALAGIPLINSTVLGSAQNTLIITDPSTCTTRLAAEFLLALPSDYPAKDKYLSPFMLPLVLRRAFRSFTLSELHLKPVLTAELSDTCQRLGTARSGDTVASRVYRATTGILARPLDQR